MALASSTRHHMSYFEHDTILSNMARDRYDSDSVLYTFFCDPCPISHFTYSDALHIIVTLYQSQPLSLKCLAMKRVLDLNVEVKDLPQDLLFQAEKVIKN